MARPTLIDGQDIGVLYRTAVETGETLDGFPLYAAAFPCAIKSAVTGCCEEEMPTTLTFVIEPAFTAGPTQTVVATYGNWFGGSLYFWRYTASPVPSTSGTISNLDFFCFASSGNSASFEAIITFIVIPDPPAFPTPYEVHRVIGPHVLACCNGTYGLTNFTFGTYYFESPLSTTSSGTSWQIDMSFPCSLGVPSVDNMSYWPALDTGETLDGFPLWAAADCISDNGVSSGSTTWPFNAMTDPVARALYRLATPTGKRLDGIPLYAAENDPCCDGGGLNPGYGSNVIVPCCDSPIPTKLHCTLTPLAPSTTPPLTFELNYEAVDPTGYAGFSFTQCTGRLHAGDFWYAEVGDVFVFLFCDSPGWQLTIAPCAGLTAGCVTLSATSCEPLYLYNDTSVFFPFFCIPGYNLTFVSVIVTE